jgi:hypothetical protein
MRVVVVVVVVGGGVEHFFFPFFADAHKKNTGNAS